MTCSFAVCQCEGIVHAPVDFTRIVDPTQGASTILVKSTGACTIPSHWHTANEQVMIATGSARLEMKGEAAKRLTTGAYAYLPSKHAHAFSCPMACSYFIMADDKFDIHYVD